MIIILYIRSEIVLKQFLYALWADKIIQNDNQMTKSIDIYIYAQYNNQLNWSARVISELP